MEASFETFSFKPRVMAGGKRTHSQAPGPQSKRPNSPAAEQQDGGSDETASVAAAAQASKPRLLARSLARPVPAIRAANAVDSLQRLRSSAASESDGTSSEEEG